MDIVGGRNYVEISGQQTHELPPLLVRRDPALNSPERVLNLAAKVIDSEDMVAWRGACDVETAEIEVERRRLDLALNLAEEYRRLITDWKWGDSILEWIRQCETTFETRPALRNLLQPDLWPHAGRRSFILLLEDKAVGTAGVDLEKAVGLRLTFRQPPPISCFSNQFLFYLKSTIASTAFETWAKMSPQPVSSFPPERFHFDVVDMAHVG